MQLNKRNISKTMSPKLKSHLQDLQLVVDLSKKFPNADYFFIRECVFSNKYTTQKLESLIRINCKNPNLRLLH